MGLSPSHKFGQLIGEVLEATIEPILRNFAEENNLFLDKKGPRPARKGKKLSWKDNKGNSHDLDFVLERGGSPTNIGIPIAFIESAWRRYTKHSKNKAQEVQGALIPLRSQYKDFSPFIGVILAGEFTKGALTQLRSLGFSILYIPYDRIVRSFKKVGIDAAFDEDTPDMVEAEKVKSWELLSEEKKNELYRLIWEENQSDILEFLNPLELAVKRTISLVRILPLYGTTNEFTTLAKALQYLDEYSEYSNSLPISKYEVEIRYSNDDFVRGVFGDRISAINFLQKF